MGRAACKSAGPGPRRTARVMGKAAGRRAGGPDSRAGAPAPHPPANGPSVWVVGRAVLSVRSQGKRVTSGPSDSPDLSAALDALLAPCCPSRRLPGFRALGARAGPAPLLPQVVLSSSLFLSWSSKLRAQFLSLCLSLAPPFPQDLKHFPSLSAQQPPTSQLFFYTHFFSSRNFFCT